MEYGVEDIPGPHLCFLFGLQQVLLSIGSTISVPLVVAINICAGDLDLVKSQIMSTFLFMCGVCTILQCSIGVRLPILQGGCHKFLPAIAALLSVEQWRCPDMTPYTGLNATLDAGDVWKPRIREIQGGIMVASVFQVLIGLTGLLGLLLRFIGPITIVPTISLVGLSLVGVALKFCQTHVGISSLTVALLLIFSLYLKNVLVPLPSYTRRDGCTIIHYPLFQLLPVILAVLISWSLCAMLTWFDVAPPTIRTDAKFAAVASADWFFFPYPCQWGPPTVSAAGVMAMMSATVASILESVGDYYACAKICGVPPPPAHAINRGIAMEGLGSLFSGLVGSGAATTSYSQNVGAIGFTKVSSRTVFCAAGAIFLLSGVVGKIGAFLTTMPDPVLGGVILVSFGMVTSVGLSALSFVDLGSSRNLTIIGTSMLLGLLAPQYLQHYPGAIATGYPDLDHVLNVLLGTAMFVGGVIAFFLDNTVPGTPEERGIKKWKNQSVTTTAACQENKGFNHAASSNKTSVKQIQETDLNNGHEPNVFTLTDVSKAGDSIRSSTSNPGSALALNFYDIGNDHCHLYDIPLVTPFLFKIRAARFFPFLPTFAYDKYQLSLLKCQERSPRNHEKVESEVANSYYGL